MRQPTSNDNCPSVLLLKFDFLGAAWGKQQAGPRRKVGASFGSRNLPATRSFDYSFRTVESRVFRSSRMFVLQFALPQQFLGPGAEGRMACDKGKQLKEEYASATKWLGLYEESLRGIARTSEHRRDRERLETENDTARRAFQDHREECPACRQDRNL